jgi:hypothetical protein
MRSAITATRSVRATIRGTAEMWGTAIMTRRLLPLSRAKGSSTIPLGSPRGENSRCGKAAYALAVSDFPFSSPRKLRNGRRW